MRLATLARSRYFLLSFFFSPFFISLAVFSPSGYENPDWRHIFISFRSPSIRICSASRKSLQQILLPIWQNVIAGVFFSHFCPSCFVVCTVCNYNLHILYISTYSVSHIFSGSVGELSCKNDDSWVKTNYGSVLD